MKNLLEIIKNIDIKNITENQIEELLPSLGMNGENVHEMPSHLSKHYNIGLKFWQYPNQFSKYLKLITNFKINSYLEIGCRWGGTFIITNEILKLNNKNVKSFACDLIGISDILSEYSNYEEFIYIRNNSANLNKENVQNKIDLILIDGDHSYNGVKVDFERSLQYSPKYVVFHDIVSDVCPGVVQFWNEIKKDYKYYEFIEQYESVDGSFLGIGLIEL
jgi:cephalosporin hydroxylase